MNVLDDILSPRQSQITELCRRHGVRRLELFGSAVTGGFDPARSDLDFLVEFRDGFPGGPANQFFGLLFGLEDLLRYRIDLVDIKTADNPYFLRVIEPSRRVLYAA